MATITIRNLDEALKARLRVRAAIHNRSMEDEARDILRNVLSAEPVESPKLGRAMHGLFAPLGGLDCQQSNESRCVNRLPLNRDFA